MTKTRMELFPFNRGTKDVLSEEIGKITTMYEIEHQALKEVCNEYGVYQLEDLPYELQVEAKSLVEERIEELSQETLGRYAVAASADASKETAKAAKRKKGSNAQFDHLIKADKRKRGHDRAISKLVDKVDKGQHVWTPIGKVRKDLYKKSMRNEETSNLSEEMQTFVEQYLKHMTENQIVNLLTMTEDTLETLYGEGALDTVKQFYEENYNDAE